MGAERPDCSCTAPTLPSPSSHPPRRVLGGSVLFLPLCPESCQRRSLPRLSPPERPALGSAVRWRQGGRPSASRLCRGLGKAGARGFPHVFTMGSTGRRAGSRRGEARVAPVVTGVCSRHTLYGGKVTISPGTPQSGECQDWGTWTVFLLSSTHTMAPSVKSVNRCTFYHNTGYQQSGV